MITAVGPGPTVEVPVSLLIIAFGLCAVVVLVMFLRHAARIAQRRAPLPTAFGDVALGVAAALVGVVLLGALTLGSGEVRAPGPTITTPVLLR